ncbi:DUF5675 family protein [Flavihumibacter sp. CACIAM 22H1]|uniref:DUF5675 family protein n=1 Tax=Flavihumibacter sp. CACIAM 22H1 TaxID=1812911 RepID=UPI0007A8E8A8|nr:DUF5675 family protein [Flavihumibacter sp. CACIAM 22H1]KYP12951.1 MAG: hypothetical protein A1D16_15815 [Flavihumibacter sp. CACIAM 22H1]
MELLLQRSYQASGTNGMLSCGNELICYTIELPWQQNKRWISCIPEQRYQLLLRYSKRHQLHLLLKDVPNRTLILIHKANNALKELKGCIGVVRELTGPGKGINSALAFRKLLQLATACINRGERLWLRIECLTD